MECDASLMDGHSGIFGAVGAVPGSSHLNLLFCNLCFNITVFFYRIAEYFGM